MARYGYRVKEPSGFYWTQDSPPFNGSYERCEIVEARNLRAGMDFYPEALSEHTEHILTGPLEIVKNDRLAFVVERLFPAHMVVYTLSPGHQVIVPSS